MATAKKKQVRESNNNKKSKIMPIGAALIPALGSLLSTGINATSQGNMNRKNRKFQKEMFDKTNEYNTPLNQVKRMKEAGLNPAMMYQGSPQNTASQVNAVKGDAYQIPENLMADVYQKIANADLAASKTVPVTINIDSAKANVENTLADTELKNQSTETGKQTSLKLVTETARIQQEYNLQKDLFNTNKSYREEQLRRLNNDNLKIEKELSYLDEETKSKIQLLKNQAIESVKRSRSLDNQDWIFKNEKELRELNINPNGNIIDTIIKYIAGSAIGAFKELFPNY